MTRFIDVPTLTQLVQTVGAERFVSELTDTITQDYLRWNDFDKSARLACHSPVGVIELMPVADASRFAFKYVNGHPGNTLHGQYTVMAFGVLADVASGYPMLLSELTLTTAFRTAATSVMAARVLAKANARSMAIIGNGAQSEFQALAFCSLMGITELRLFDTDPLATAKLVRNLSQLLPAELGVSIVQAASTLDAVRGADIVTTITADKTLATIITPDMIAPGMHLNAVGGDCPGKTELHADVLRQARVFVEYEPQTRVEGDIQQLPSSFAVTELWQVLQGKAAGRASASDITVFDSVGFALEDYSALRYVYALALQHQLGVEVELVPGSGSGPTGPGSDPKDLFGLLRPRPAQRAKLRLAA